MSYESTTAGKSLSTTLAGQDHLHPDYIYYLEDWEKIRDAISGERRVKEAGTKYLPPQAGKVDENYKNYKRRAVYVNMVARTVNGLVGTVFRREIKVTGITKKIRGMLDNVSIDGHSLNLFSKQLSYEVFSVGRVGVLVDRPRSGGKPYMTAYIAENILDWQEEVIEGRKVLTYVLLREIYDGGHAVKKEASSVFKYRRGAVSNRLKVQYRRLVLEGGVYRQEIYRPNIDGEVNLDGAPSETIIPLRNGSKLDKIPFYIQGPMSPTPKVQRPPVLDITTLNFAHYRTSAQLEHGRFFTALPIYYVPLAAGQGRDAYTIDPHVVWEVPLNSKPGILEYFGTGLTELTKSMIEKEEAISNLGGRIMGIRSAGTTESEQVYKMKQANELSILLNVTEAMNEGLSKALGWWLEWQDINPKGVAVKMNQDFKSLNIASRELRAISLLYQEGILPVSEVYRVLQEAEFVDDNVTLEEFTFMLNNAEANFPKQPDVVAKREGYSDADARLRDELHKREDTLERDKMKMDEKRAKEEAKAKAEADAAQRTLEDNMLEDGKNLSRFKDQEAKNAEVKEKEKVKKKDQ